MPRDSSRPTAPKSKRRLPPRLLPRLRALGEREKLQLCCFMSGLVNGEGAAAIIEHARRPYLACPRCQGTALHRCGHANGLQRYRCKCCARTFNALTGTPLARLRLKTHWLAYFDALLDPGCTVHRAAQNVGVHASTSFRWRHRFLEWTKLDRPQRLEGVAELAAFRIMASEKGSRHLHRSARRRAETGKKRSGLAHLVELVFARDRSGKTIDLIAAPASLAATAMQTQLLPRLASDVLLVAERPAAVMDFATRAVIAFASTCGAHHPITKRVVHVVNVSAYIDRFKHWLRHFNGVATRYLCNYLGWRWAIDGARIRSAEQFLIAALGIFTT